MGLPPTYSHTCQTPWSVFQDGPVEAILSTGDHTGAASTGFAGATNPAHIQPRRERGLTRTCQSAPAETQPVRRPKGSLSQGLPPADKTKRETGSKRFPPNNFKHFLTLFSKFFASFPHGTCSLSVSRQYLALDEIYHPFRAGISTNSTLRDHIVREDSETLTGISPSMSVCSKTLIPGPFADNDSIDYNSKVRLHHRFSA